MIEHITYEQKEKCSGCMACASECPTQCIHFEYDEEGILIRVKKETERGVMTIQESETNLQK